jgi:hypothetical protein
VGRELLVAGGVDEPVGAVAEMRRDRADDRGLRDARKAEQEDGLAARESGEQEAQLGTPPDHFTADLRWKLSHGATLSIQCTFEKVNL